MANPKRRHSKQRKRKRRSHDFLTAVSSVECKQCREFKLPHRVCPSCGYYDGKEVVVVEEG